jgi:hypothetical protein
MSSLEGIREKGNMLFCLLCDVLCMSIKNLLKKKRRNINVHSYFFFLLSGYSRNQTAPMSPRSYSAYTNAYGQSATAYGVPSPCFLNGKLSTL